MIAAWMLGSTVFALLLCVAAFCIERILRMTGRATRTPWAVALVLAVVWPLMAPIVLMPQSSAAFGTALPLKGDPSAAAMLAAQMPSQTALWEQRVATLLPVVWIVLTVFMLMRLLIAARVLAQVTRVAKQVQIDGESVLVTESLGPAVIGLWTPKVAVPEWFLGLDASLRTMVLRHEREHCTSRDPQLVWLASLAVALMPWNAGVWVLSRRLRLALEIDCDARTLRRDVDSAKYGKLLLLIAQRQSSYPLASMLAESTSHLSRRIRAMQMKPLRKPVVRVVLLTAVATGAIAVACSPRVASDLTGPGVRPVSPTAVKLEAEKMAAGTVFFEYQVERPVAQAPGSPGPKYPVDLKTQGVEGRVLAMFVVNEDGLPEVASLKITNADNPAFAQSVRDALPSMRFMPAEIGGRKVKQLVQQPFMFALSEAGKKTSGTIAGFNEPASGTTDAKLVAERNAGAIRTKPGATATPSIGNQDGIRPKPQTVNGPYFESQVEKPVSVAASFKGPEYPADLKARHVEGTILAMFVVNEDGFADMSTFKVVKASEPAFEAAVRTAVSEGRFTPALIGGRAVKQIVQQPFTFSVSR